MQQNFNRVYTNAWLKLPVGKARYGVMLREDGIVMDDGTTTRISENHYHMTTTTAQAANVLSHLEYYLQLVWPELNVNVVSTLQNNGQGLQSLVQNQEIYYKNYFQILMYQKKICHLWAIWREIYLELRLEFLEFHFLESLHMK